jgi:SAM-dependent methyltransferase
MAVDRFGESIAATYDDPDDAMFASDLIAGTVAFLVDHARGGAALELAIGTGRIAVPLSAAGVALHGIDLSEAMLARLRAKPGAERIGITVGDFAVTRVPGTYSLAYLVFNTIMNLTTQDEQVACFANVAAQLEPGGRFVVEVMVPDLQRLPPGETVRFTGTPTKLGFDEYDVVTQGLVSHHYRLAGPSVETTSVPFRYVWPAELDLMARLAGMVRLERWGDWSRTPFTPDSTQHVSAWQKVA